MHNKKTLLSRAGRLGLNQIEATGLHAQVPATEPASLTARNALERMCAAERHRRWMHVNGIIDSRDDIVRSFASHRLTKIPIRGYLSGAWRTMCEVILLWEQLDRPLIRMQSVLELAAGFRRFTCHLACTVPDRATCTDIQRDSVEFLRDQPGVEPFSSALNTEKFICPPQYELNFVLSLFILLPIERCGARLKHLYRRLKPAGLLISAGHSENAAKQEGVTFGHRGRHFIHSGEFPQLGADDHGATIATEKSVALQVDCAPGCKPLLHEQLAFRARQKAVVESA